MMIRTAAERAQAQRRLDDLTSALVRSHARFVQQGLSPSAIANALGAAYLQASYLRDALVRADRAIPGPTSSAQLGADDNTARHC